MVLPPLAIAQAEIDYAAILTSVTSPWFLVMWFAVAYLSWAWASVRPHSDIKTWFTIFATIIVLMWLRSHGVFRNSEDFSRSTPCLTGRGATPEERGVLLTGRTRRARCPKVVEEQSARRCGGCLEHLT